jgi:hypothetical protein
VWYRLKRYFKAMGNATSWLDGDSHEPDWPTERKPLHLCEGCGQERARDSFAAVDAVMAGQRVLLVRCDECRAAKLSTPFDSKGK